MLLSELFRLLLGCVCDNLRMSQPILFKFLSVINHGYGKVPIVFQQDPKFVERGGGGAGEECACPHPPFKHRMTQ